MLNEYPRRVLPDKVKIQLNQDEIELINYMDDKAKLWFKAKWTVLLIAAIFLIAAIIQDSNALLLSTFVNLALYFVCKYQEIEWESDLEYYLIEIQLYLAGFKKD